MLSVVSVFTGMAEVTSASASLFAAILLFAAV